MKYSLLLLALLFLHGCAHLGHFDSSIDRVQLVDQYLAEHEYSKALTLISNTSKEDPQARKLEKRRKTILDQLHTYEQQTIAIALKQERKNDWPAAKLTYEEALKKHNTSKPLDEAQEAMLKRFHRRMDALECEELIGTGEWLSKKLPLLRTLHESDPENLIIQWKYFRTENEVKEIARELVKTGEQMLAEDNLAMAQRILPLAAKLASGPESESAVHRLDSKLKKREVKKEKSRRIIAQKKDEKEIEAFNQAMAHGKLSEARQHLTRLTPTTATSVDAELMQERLDRAISNFIQEEISIGDSFYRAGEYEQSIKVWQNILRLEPGNETAQSKLKRAEKIVEKLNTLQRRQEKQ